MMRARGCKKSYIVVLSLLLVGIIVGTVGGRGEQKAPVTVYVSGALVERDIDDLFEQATAIVTGKVVETSEAFQIQHVNGSVSNFTDSSFSVESVLKGEPGIDNITIRVQGGTVGDYTEVYEHDPKLSKDEDYLLFLYKPGRGGAYNTEGDYYYILGVTQGTFSKNEEGMYESQVGKILSNEQLIATASEGVAVDENYFRNEYIENQKRNLQNGFITESQYKLLMENIDQYATILK